MLNINRACQTCHRWPEDELRARVETIQDRTFEIRNVAMDAVIALIADITAAQDRGADAVALEQARRHHRRAQFLLDFIEAENSMGFHADQESVRVLALSLDETRRGQVALRGAGSPPAAPSSQAAARQK
jgi:nitrite reductase (cytochrome c-552)